VSNAVNQILEYCGPIVRWIIAPVCPLCGGRAGRDGLCHGCQASLPRLPRSHCPVCAIGNASAELCGRCVSVRPFFDRVIAPFTYGFPVSVLIQGLKYRGELACARPLAAAMANVLDKEPYPDLLVPMPLTNTRLAGRGFNQAMEISRYIAAEFGLSIAADACYRKGDGTPQTSLPWKKRASNVRNAFTCSANIEGKSIAVVDDVLTTGATLNELARILKLSGAREVTGWIAARTPAPGDL
jgi:ComF family protein